MSLGFIILIIILSVIFIILTYLLFVPITLCLNIRIDNKVSTIQSVKIFPFQYKFVRKKAKKPAKPVKVKVLKIEKPEEEEKRGFSFLRLNRSDVITIFDLISEAIKFLGRLVKAPHYFLKVDLTGGASQPDITGEIYGAYQALKYTLPESVSLSYRPDFNADKFKGTVELSLAFRIIKILKETLILIFRLPIIKLIKLYRKLKKGE